MFGSFSGARARLQSLANQPADQSTAQPVKAGSSSTESRQSSAISASGINFFRALSALQMLGEP